MTSTLDETLGDSNPHYSRVLREKIAAREAAWTAMEARKAALVEASWCRILKAARIQSKDAEALLEEAEKKVAEGFEAAAALGVIMYDRPDFPRKACEIESSSVNMGGSTTHTVTASFETPFEVDKEVAAAVKIAFIRLANCPSSFDKDEHKDLLRKISENPDMDEANEDLSECSSGCESDTQSQMESDSQAAKFIEYDTNFTEDEKKQSKVLKVSCNLNNAACKLKLKDYKQAEKLCTKVLEIETGNVKALYRRAQAHIQLADLDLAELDIKKALEIDPNNRDVKMEYKKLKEKMKELNKKDAQFYGNIFAKMSKLETLDKGGAKDAEPMTIESKA